MGRAGERKNRRQGINGQGRKGQMASGNCENCVNYKYEEDYDCYICDMDLDEDEMVRFLSASFENCPYFQLEDEYRIVRKQM